MHGLSYSKFFMCSFGEVAKASQAKSVIIFHLRHCRPTSTLHFQSVDALAQKHIQGLLVLKTRISRSRV